ncbi:ankyrin repeat-containing domain protein [Xylaria palmicola]|nr:ankyrin repeat-containing domain protein [Xylaria palmicola]
MYAPANPDSIVSKMASTSHRQPAIAPASPTHGTVISSDNLCRTLDKLTMSDEPPGLLTLPNELILIILDYLPRKKDWCALARVSRRVSRCLRAELAKFMVTDPDTYALWYACVANKPDLLLRLVAHTPAFVDHRFTRSFPNKRTGVEVGQGMTPLGVAISAGHHVIIHHLLAHHADPNLPDCTPSSLNPVLWLPIHRAVRSKHESSVVIISMLAAHSANMDQAPEQSPDHVESRSQSRRYSPIFPLLKLDKPRKILRHDQVTSCEEFNRDFLKLQSLRLQQLETLLHAGADPNTRQHWNSVTPVCFLLSSLNALDPGFYFSSRLITKQDAADQAELFNGIVATFLDVLRDAGADPCAYGNGTETPLHMACRLPDRHKPLINWFLDHGASIDAHDETARTTPLMTYCKWPFVDIDQFHQFLRNGPMINFPDSLGRTALHHLCANLHLAIQVKEKAVRAMLAGGADPMFRSKAGLTPAQELPPPSIGQKEDYLNRDILLMFKKANEKWEATARRTKKNLERAYPTEVNQHSGHTNGRRQGRGGRGRSRRGLGYENQHNQNVNEHSGHTTDQQQGSGSRGRGRREPSRENRHNQNTNEQKSHGAGEQARGRCRRSYRGGCQGGHQRSRHNATQTDNGNTQSDNQKNAPQGRSRNTPKDKTGEDMFKGSSQHGRKRRSNRENRVCILDNADK